MTVENPGTLGWVTSEFGTKGAWQPNDHPETKWNVYELDGPNSAAPTSAISAVKHIIYPGSLDLFWIGPDGIIRHRWKTGDGLKWTSQAEI